MDAASGAVTTAHGLGVIPKRIRITGLAGSSSATKGRGGYSFGTYDGTNNRSIWQLTGVDFGCQNENSTTYIVKLSNDDDNNDYQTAVATFDATNITLTWTRTGSDGGGITGQILWEAEGY